jgi:hypothetical protein
VTTERDILDALWARCAAGTVAGMPSGHYAFHGYEVKVSRGDYLREVRDPRKHETWARHCERWWIVAPDVSVVGPGDLPHGWGLLLLWPNGVLHQQRAALRRRDPAPLPLLAMAGLMRAAQQTAERHAVARTRAEYDARTLACPVHSDPCMECP